jgi:hypothetical protein
LDFRTGGKRNSKTLLHQTLPYFFMHSFVELTKYAGKEKPPAQTEGFPLLR